jgi:hypothetical protein
MTRKGATLSKDRLEELATAMGEIVHELAADKETDLSILAILAVNRLYQRYPDLTMQELKAVTDHSEANQRWRSTR